MAPAAVVPVHTPEEAIEEATYAVRELGLKVIMIANHVRRPVPAFAREVGGPDRRRRIYIDSLGFESAYDYDPFWQACVDLKVAVTAHSGSMGWHGRESVNNFTYNHIGHFANASHAFARALILGGVTHRFPQLRFALARGRRGLGVQPRHRPRRPLGEAPAREAMEAQTRPTNLDQQMLKDLFARYGGRAVRGEDGRDLRVHQHRRAVQDAEELTERAYRQTVRRLRRGARASRPRSCGATSPSTSTSAARPTTR